MAPPGHRATAFGKVWTSDLPLAEFLEADGLEKCAPLGEVAVRRSDSVARRTPLRIVNRGAVYADGIRLDWNGEVVFDMFEGTCIDYVPGARWPGSLPSSFYSTIAALTVAWSGVVPLHACAVEIDGKAFVIAGASGTGKSSLAAGLIALGALLVADDLTIIRPGGDGGAIEVFAGRPTMRQHAGTAALVPSDSCTPIAGDRRRKWLVKPTARTSRPSLPLGGIFILDGAHQSSDAVARIAALASNLFRPRWLAALPNHGSIRRDLLAIAGTVPVRIFPAIESFEAASQLRRAERAMGAIEAMTMS